MKPLLPVAEALQRLLDAAQPVSTVERIGLAAAADRVLASDLKAQITQPRSTPRPWTATRCAPLTRQQSAPN